jgi:hypothetical protein
MSDDQDPMIRRLFAENEQSLPPDDFMLRLGERMNARERARRVQGIAAAVACLVLSALAAPWIAQITATLIDFASGGISTVVPLLSAPLTWLAVGTAAALCSPIVYLWRTGRW